MHKFLNANTRTIGYKTYYLQKYVDRLKTFSDTTSYIPTTGDKNIFLLP